MFSHVFLEKILFLSNEKNDDKLGENFIIFANAWGEEAHKTIGMTAMSGVRSNELPKILHLTNRKDIADVSVWADKVALKYPETASLHFQKHPFFQCDKVITDSNTNCKEGRCIVNALTYFYRELAGISKDKNINDEDSFIHFSFPNKKDLTDSDKLKFLINLIADLHQPFHLGFFFDDAGKKIKVSMENEEGGETTLFDLWEKAIVDKISAERQHFWNSGWTHIKNLNGASNNVYEREERAFAKNKEKMFTIWAEESLQILCNYAYSISDGTSDYIIDKEIIENEKKKMEEQTDANKGETEITENDIQSKLTITPQIEFFLFSKIKAQILLAGARTAIVLNDIFANREKGSVLRVGSAIDDVTVENEEHLPLNDTPIWIKNLIKNLGVILLLFGGIMLSIWYYSSAETSVSDDGINKKEKSEEMKTQKFMYLNQKEKEMEQKDS